MKTADEYFGWCNMYCTNNEPKVVARRMARLMAENEELKLEMERLRNCYDIRKKKLPNEWYY